jgi:hypothetical protein
MKRILIGSVLALASIAAFTPAHAAAPTATLGTGPGTYTVNVTADHGTFAISQGNAHDPFAAGGCHDNYVKTRRSYYVSGVTCTTAGTIQFTTTVFVACETPLNLTQDGVVIQSWSLNAPCPPPAPPAVVVTYGDGIASFDNTAATVDQTAVFSAGVPVTYTTCDPLDTTCTPQPIPPSSCQTASTDATFTAHLTSHFAGIGLNRYVYYTLDGVDYVHVPAGTVTYVAWTCV